MLNENKKIVNKKRYNVNTLSFRTLYSIFLLTYILTYEFKMQISLKIQDLHNAKNSIERKPPVINIIVGLREHVVYYSYIWTTLTVCRRLSVSDITEFHNLFIDAKLWI